MTLGLLLDVVLRGDFRGLYVGLFLSLSVRDPLSISLCHHLKSSPYVTTLCHHLKSSPYVTTLSQPLSLC
ncbi:hypothetical protein YPBV_gp01 [Yersinia phage Berlin]|uniref:Uncharacterized protein n=1 Tax=Yersinia phage Berlin TaxID=369257 RepID=A0ZXK4_9CAUD|nr:hypothetical protein YPBV_gp01 [Yersinia phage Berlin]CAJ70651.1 hypothetical protein [Yersinia phage Berlin]